MIDQSAILQGDALRAQIAASTKDFLRKGGKITKLSNRIGEPPKVGMWNNSLNPDAEAASRRRGDRNGAKAQRQASPRKGATPQARKNNVLREVWA
jgi:hypothetical protein